MPLSWTTERPPVPGWFWFEDFTLKIGPVIVMWTGSTYSLAGTEGTFLPSDQSQCAGPLAAAGVRGVGNEYMGGKIVKDSPKQAVKDFGMAFEHALQLFFGDRAYQTAGQASNPKHCRDWLKKVLRAIMKRIDQVETTPRHKEVLMMRLERVNDAVDGQNQPTWHLVFQLVALIGSLLGYASLKGALMHSVSYWQTESQYLTADILSGSPGNQLYEDKQDAISWRRKIVVDLKKKGLSDFKMALILRTSEYEVGQLRRGQ